MSPDWTINSMALKTVCKNQFVMDGSMAVVQSCYVSSRLESWFEIIHVKPPKNVEVSVVEFQSQWAVKKNISHPTKLVGQQVCSSFMNRAHVTDHGSQSTFKHFSRNLFSVTKKKIMSDRRFVNLHKDQVLIPFKKKKTFN